MCVYLLDQYSNILVWVAGVGNWSDEDGWCVGQHFQQATSVKTSAWQDLTVCF